MKTSFVLFLGLSAVVSLGQSIRPTASTPNSTLLVGNYGKLPMAFEANQGQTNQQVKFLSRGAGYSLFLTPTEAVLAQEPSANGDHPPGFRSQAPVVGKIKSPAAVLRMKLINANPQAEMSGQDELSGKSNYFIGNDLKKWHTNVPQFAMVSYKNVYPGVDLVYYGNQGELEYDFVLRPRADPQQIRLGFDGARKLRLNHGDLVLSSARGEIQLRRPRVYQQVNGLRQEVHGRYVMKSKNEMGFRIASYNRTKRPKVNAASRDTWNLVFLAQLNTSYKSLLCNAPTADQSLTSGFPHNNRGKVLVVGTHCALTR